MSVLRFALLLFLFGLSGCSESEEFEEDLYSEKATFDEGEVRGGETYGEFDKKRDDLEGSAGSYEEYDCTEDCSGHEAGYEWAAEKGIDDPEDCGGKSWSFEEGCRAYAEENGSY